MKSDIATYLQQGPEGKFYYRMIDTVLTRDKNWTHWKADNCPLIERPSLPAEHVVEAQKGAQKVCANKKLKATPLGSLDLNFLSDAHHGDGFLPLTDPERLGETSTSKACTDSIRYSIPTADAFQGAIADDDFDIDTAQSDEKKQQATDARASKLWRALRVASKNRLNLLDKIDDGHNLQALFNRKEEDENHVSTESNEEHLPGEGSKDVTESSEIDRNGTGLPDQESAITEGSDAKSSSAPERNGMSVLAAPNIVPTEISSEIP